MHADQHQACPRPAPRGLPAPPPPHPRARTARSAAAAPGSAASTGPSSPAPRLPSPPSGPEGSSLEERSWSGRWGFGGRRRGQARVRVCAVYAVCSVGYAGYTFMCGRECVVSEGARREKRGMQRCCVSALPGPGPMRPAVMRTWLTCHADVARCIRCHCSHPNAHQQHRLDGGQQGAGQRRSRLHGCRGAGAGVHSGSASAGAAVDSPCLRCRSGARRTSLLRCQSMRRPRMPAGSPELRVAPAGRSQAKQAEPTRDAPPRGVAVAGPLGAQPLILHGLQVCEG